MKKKRPVWAIIVLAIAIVLVASKFVFSESSDYLEFKSNKEYIICDNPPVKLKLIEKMGTLFGNCWISKGDSSEPYFFIAVSLYDKDKKLITADSGAIAKPIEGNTMVTYSLHFFLPCDINNIAYLQYAYIWSNKKIE